MRIIRGERKVAGWGEKRKEKEDDDSARRRGHHRTIGKKEGGREGLGTGGVGGKASGMR